MSDKQGAILVVRLSAMGDIVHTLPAAATLKKSFPERKLIWVVASRWMPLLQGNPFIDQIIPFDRVGLLPAKSAWRRLQDTHAAWAFDFQGLVYSALIGRAARPKVLFGFHSSVAREPLASLFYTCRVPVKGPHRVERNVQLAEAAGARERSYEAWIPDGVPEGDLPSGPFVLASPFAGWTGKEWPIECYEDLGRRLGREGLQLVVNVPETRAHELVKLRHVQVHTSTLSGLIAATHRATAVIGVDSGPLHLAAALSKPGVALFGPTAPLRTGPFGGSMSVLRAHDVETTYKRHARIHASMKAITMEQVAEALLRSLATASSPGPAAKRDETVAARHK